MNFPFSLQKNSPDVPCFTGSEVGEEVSAGAGSTLEEPAGLRNVGGTLDQDQGFSPLDEDPRDRKWFITIATIVNSSMHRWDKLLNGDLLIRPRWLCCFWFMVDIKLDSGVYKSANTNGGHQHVQIDCHSFFSVKVTDPPKWSR